MYYSNPRKCILRAIVLRGAATKLFPRVELVTPGDFHTNLCKSTDQITFTLLSSKKYRIFFGQRYIVSFSIAFVKIKKLTSCSELRSSVGSSKMDGLMFFAPVAARSWRNH
ncbi:unnamed protein product [Brassica rapa]|uniref:Uncharacterized protein n=2 Tax=Brassica TaxID=3705 RepID=A0A8D9CWT1_BRACM|nr:unnamed protein product [Brassica napus]CAG7865116.1 unnamed protein product [Brassica rapa]CAG7895432.1 unnamed protein product [Brassica rapa]